ncbi:MAG: poly(R)-hydroxyalkanoic acid synthase subunit PhaE [Halobacteriaceae archaeon]
MADNWESFFRQVNESYSEALERNLDAQAEFVETWTEALDGEQMDEGVEGVARAYEAWMDAAEEAVELTEDAAAGDVGPGEFRDLWLDAANTAFKRVMGTSAFAAATGQVLDDALDVQSQMDEVTEETLHGYGFATSGDVEEVGERLVELERRQHAVEEKLDEILDELR